MSVNRSRAAAKVEVAYWPILDAVPEVAHDAFDWGGGASDARVTAVAWQDPENLRPVIPGTFKSYLSYPHWYWRDLRPPFTRQARIEVSFTDGESGECCFGGGTALFGFVWADENGESRSTCIYHGGGLHFSHKQWRMRRPVCWARGHPQERGVGFPDRPGGDSMLVRLDRRADGTRVDPRTQPLDGLAETFCPCGRRVVHLSGDSKS